MRYLLIPFLLACSTPDPEKYGKCEAEITAYSGSKALGSNWCKWKGYMWQCYGSSSDRRCDRKYPLPPEQQ